MGNPIAVAMSQTISHSSLPVRVGSTGRTRLRRRSALVNVPSFSRNDVPGRKTCAYFAVSLRKRSCTTTRLHRRQRLTHVVEVGVGLGDVLALDVEPLERPADRGVEHVGDPQPRLGVQRQSPHRLVDAADVVEADVAVARQLVREGAHVAGALHVVLPAERVDADAFTPDVSRDHGQVGQTHDHRRALTVLGDAESVVDRRVGSSRVEARSRPKVSAGSIPVAAAVASGEFSSPTMKARYSSTSSHRERGTPRRAVPR